jgi:hypothetical protein
LLAFDQVSRRHQEPELDVLGKPGTSEHRETQRLALDRTFGRRGDHRHETAVPSKQSVDNQRKVISLLISFRGDEDRKITPKSAEQS